MIGTSPFPPPPFATLFTYMIFIYLQSFIYVNFSRVFNIANQWLTRHSPFAPLCDVDEWRAKSSPFWIQGGFSKFSRIMAANNTKRSEKKNRKWLGFEDGFSRGWERKSTTVFLLFIDKVDYSCSKGLWCVCNIQNNTWLLVDVKFFFSCSTRT